MVSSRFKVFYSIYGKDGAALVSNHNIEVVAYTPEAARKLVADSERMRNLPLVVNVIIHKTKALAPHDES